jgi:hypothetical protein
VLVDNVIAGTLGKALQILVLPGRNGSAGADTGQERKEQKEFELHVSFF